MKNIRKNYLPSPVLGPNTAKQTSSGRRSPGRLAKRFRTHTLSGDQSPPGSLTSPSPSPFRRNHAFPILAFLAVLALGLLFLLPGGPLHAQDADGSIMYAENGTGAVATFTAVDPEGESIVWSLAIGADMDDFSIENGCCVS